MDSSPVVFRMTIEIRPRFSFSILFRFSIGRNEREQFFNFFFKPAILRCERFGKKSNRLHFSTHSVNLQSSFYRVRFFKLSLSIDIKFSIKLVISYRANIET